MKRVALMLSVLVGAIAQADVLLWQLDDTTTLPEGWVSDGYPMAQVVEARLVAGAAYGSGTLLQKAAVDFSDSPVMERQAFDLSEAIPVTDLTAQSFYIELYSFDRSDSPVLQAYSAIVTYNQLSEFMSSSLMTADLRTWNGGTFTAAPEPTGGMLVLLGLGVLGLRRRRMA